MKNTLLDLIDHIEVIKANFHHFEPDDGLIMPAVDLIHKDPVFCDWSQSLLLELQEIYDVTKDKFIWETTVIIKQGFDGWQDEKSFNKLTGSLKAIRNNIDKYYPHEIRSVKLDEEKAMCSKPPKIFISHSSKDTLYVRAIVDFLDNIGLSESDIFCSSVEGFGIPMDEDIYDYLKKQFDEYQLHVFFVLSNNYYQSPACLNEMGAAWVLQNKYSTVLLPGFSFKEIQGAVNPQQIGLKLDDTDTAIKNRLGQLRDIITAEFGLSKITDVRWEEKRDKFFADI